MTNNNAFLNLINLKKQERELADQIKLAQEKAIEAAMELGQVGKIATIEGAKVTFKLVSVKPTSPMIKALEEDIAELTTELKEANADEIHQLEQRIKELTTNDDILELEIKLAQEIAKSAGEKKPQIAITLPKQ